MQEPQQSKSTEGRKPIEPWQALVAVWFFAELPTVLAPNGVALSAFRPTGEILVLLTVAAVSYRFRFGRILRWLAVAIAIVLSVVRVDRAVFFVLTRSEPLLYDQMFMLRHLIVMLSDVLGLHAVPAILGILLAAAVAVFCVRWLLRRAAPLLSPDRIRTTLVVGLAVWASFLTATVVGVFANVRVVRWMVPELAANLAESTRIYRAVQQSVTHSEYVAFDRVHLTRKPDVFVFFIESYGKICAEQPEMRGPWEHALNGMQSRLSERGWTMATGFGTAPVSGARSWLAVSSIFFGTKIGYEAEFQQVTRAVGRIPTMVTFFSKQDYETIILAPSDRVRPGVQVSNDYGFDQNVTFDQLDYHGTKIGFGIMPDQYALGYAEEHVLSRVPRPVFLAYQMVSSHADWKTIPDFVSDWHTLNHDSGPPTKLGFGSEIGTRLVRYSREVPQWAYMGRLTSVLRERYEQAILYDMRVIEDFVARRQKDTLVIVMGDHQPPLVSPEAADFEVPIHLFARDPALLSEFLDHGFTPGLTPSGQSPAAVEHAGLYSLIVRALARCCGDGSPLPKYYPTGSALDSRPEP